MLQLENMSEELLEQEKERLRSATAFQLLDYIKQSVEIIMGLKQEEAANETAESRSQIANDEAKEEGLNGNLTVTSVGSVESSNLIMQSMRDAIISMNEKVKRIKSSGTNQYEKMIQKLESDVRGHIKVSYHTQQLISNSWNMK